jgi:hypothetical protein
MLLSQEKTHSKDYAIEFEIAGAAAILKGGR